MSVIYCYAKAVAIISFPNSIRKSRACENERERDTLSESFAISFLFKAAFRWFIIMCIGKYIEHNFNDHTELQRILQRV